MVRSTSALKAAVLVLAASSLGQAALATDAVTNGAMTPQQKALKDVDLSSFGIDEQGDGRKLWNSFGFNWSVLMCK